MSLIVKNGTGESVTVAVTKALREKLQRPNRAKHGTLAKRLVEIGRDCARHLPREARSLSDGKLLYNDSGLPS